jgi:hypothetical protein
MRKHSVPYLPPAGDRGRLTAGDQSSGFWGCWSGTLRTGELSIRRFRSLVWCPQAINQLLRQRGRGVIRIGGGGIAGGRSGAVFPPDRTPKLNGAISGLGTITNGSDLSGLGHGLPGKIPPICIGYLYFTGRIPLLNDSSRQGKIALGIHRARDRNVIAHVGSREIGTTLIQVQSVRDAASHREWAGIADQGHRITPGSRKIRGRRWWLIAGGNNLRQRVALNRGAPIQTHIIGPTVGIQVINDDGLVVVTHGRATEIDAGGVADEWVIETRGIETDRDILEHPRFINGANSNRMLAGGQA